MPPRQKTEVIQVSVHYAKIGDVIRLAGQAYSITKKSRISNEKYEIRATPTVGEEVLWIIPAKGIIEVIREISPDAYYFTLGSKQEAWDFWVDVLSGEREDWKPETLAQIERMVAETQS